MRKCPDYSQIHVRDVKKDLQQFGKKKILVAPLHGPQIAIFVVFFCVFLGQIPIFWMVRAYFANTQESKIEGGIHLCGQKVKKHSISCSKGPKTLFYSIFGTLALGTRAVHL